MKKLPQKIVIFGRPGSGKSTFASWLSCQLRLPLHHLDKSFFIANWIERNYDEFLEIHEKIITSNAWVIDGNNKNSLERRWQQADLVLYFNYPRRISYFRILKRFIHPNKGINDKAPGCKEAIKLRFLKYTWTFEKRVGALVNSLEKRYPKVIFKEIRNDKALEVLRNALMQFSAKEKE